MEKTNYPKLEMTPQRERVYTLLETLLTYFKNPNEYNLKQWYLGALYTIDNQNNPDRVSQAAHSLRELMEKLVIIILGENIDTKRVRQKEQKIEEFYIRIDPMWNFRSTDTKDSMIKRFMDLRKRLEDITHHQLDDRPTSKEFRKYIEQLEEILLELESYIMDKEDEKTKRILEKIEEKKIEEKNSKEIVETILKLRETDSYYILGRVSKIALEVKPLEESIKLKNWVVACSKVCLDPVVISNLLKYWSEKDINEINMGIELIKEIVFFELAPRHNEEIGTWERIQPRPKLRVWQYCEILREGVCSVSEDRPFEIASILIEATSNMLAMREKDDDYSEIWCKNLEGVKDKCKHMMPTEAMRKLMQTLTFACKQVYEKETISTIEELDALLTKERWAFFKRLRCHLYSLNPNEQTKPKIRKLILDYEYRNEREYGYEFQKMVRIACEYFDEQLLTKDERQNIFDIISEGPSKEKFRRFVEAHGELFKEEDFDKTKKHFHVRLFKPFSTVLLGQYKNYYKELTETEDITDEDYKEKSGDTYFVIPQSPIPKATLSQYTDQKLLDCINNNQERESKIEGENHIEIGIEGLAKEFGTLFSESIINTPRIDFWLQNLKNIKHSIYVSSIFTEISKDIREGNFELFDTYLKFCKKILPILNEELYIEHYYDVVNFIEACLSKGELLAIKKNHQLLLELLCKLCTEYGFRISEEGVIPTLTKEGKITVNSHDAHGRARERALSALVALGYRIRQYDTKANLNAITTVLEKRLDDNFLTLPERMTLAEEYRNIHILEPRWAMQYKYKFFPRDNLEFFEKTFARFLDTNQADIETFKIIRKELLFSIKNLTEFKIIEDSYESFPSGRDRKKLIEVLENHLAYYYILGAYPLEGEESLLRKYYHKIGEMKEKGGEIFYTMGYLARNCEKGSEQKFKDYFDWRFPEEEKEENKRIKRKELEQFVPNWLDAKYLDIEWRLNSYSKILDIGPPRYADIQSTTLKAMLPKHLEKVIECFAKLVRALKSHPDKGIEYCIYKERIEPILVTGLESNNKNVHKNAEQACKDLAEMDDHNWVSDLIEKYNVN